MLRKLFRTAEEKKQEKECESVIGKKRLDEFFYCKENYKKLKDCGFETEKAENRMRFFGQRAFGLPYLPEKERKQAGKDWSQAENEYFKWRKKYEEHVRINNGCLRTIDIVEKECDIRFKK